MFIHDMRYLIIKPISVGRILPDQKDLFITSNLEMSVIHLDKENLNSGCPEEKSGRHRQPDDSLLLTLSWWL